MEAEKRKAHENDVVSGPTPKKARVRPGQNASAAEVDEEEVEEFYAIIRRIHSAVAYFEKVPGKGWRFPAKGSTWRHDLEKEIFDEINRDAGGEKLKRIEDAQRNAGFNLNANPDSDENAGVQINFV